MRPNTFAGFFSLVLVGFFAVAPIAGGAMGGDDRKSSERSAGGMEMKKNRFHRDKAREEAVKLWPKVDLSRYQNLYIEDALISDPKAVDREDQDAVRLAPRRIADYVSNWVTKDAFPNVARGLPREGASGVILQIELTEYKPGNQKARSFFFGLVAGSIHLDFTVHLRDAETGEVLKQIGDAQTSRGHGVVGGAATGIAKSIADAEENAAQDIALYLALCKGIDIEGLLWEQRTANPSAGTDLTTGEYGTIYLYRPGKSTGWRVRLPLAVDGRAIDQVRNRTYYLLHVSPGEHVLSVNMERDHYEISVDVEAGKTSWVRLGPKRTKWQFALMEENSEVKKRNQCEIAKELNLTSGN